MLAKIESPAYAANQTAYPTAFTKLQLKGSKQNKAGEDPIYRRLLNLARAHKRNEFMTSGASASANFTVHRPWVISPFLANITNSAPYKVGFLIAQFRVHSTALGSDVDKQTKLPPGRQIHCPWCKALTPDDITHQLLQCGAHIPGHGSLLLRQRFLPKIVRHMTAFSPLWAALYHSAAATPPKKSMLLLSCDEYLHDKPQLDRIAPLLERWLKSITLQHPTYKKFKHTTTIARLGYHGATVPRLTNSDTQVPAQCKTSNKRNKHKRRRVSQQR
jgi:hypothetical protein